MFARNKQMSKVQGCASMDVSSVLSDVLVSVWLVIWLSQLRATWKIAGMIVLSLRYLKKRSQQILTLFS